MLAASAFASASTLTRPDASSSTPLPTAQTQTIRRSPPSTTFAEVLDVAVSHPSSQARFASHSCSLRSPVQCHCELGEPDSLPPTRLSQSKRVTSGVAVSGSSSNHLIPEPCLLAFISQSHPQLSQLIAQQLHWIIQSLQHRRAELQFLVATLNHLCSELLHASSKHQRIRFQPVIDAIIQLTTLPIHRTHYAPILSIAHRLDGHNSNAHSSPQLECPLSIHIERLQLQSSAQSADSECPSIRHHLQPAEEDEHEYHTANEDHLWEPDIEDFIHSTDSFPSDAHFDLP